MILSCSPSKHDGKYNVSAQPGSDPGTERMPILSRTRRLFISCTSVKKLSDLTKHPQDLRKVLGVYLNLSKPYKAVSNRGHPVLLAYGFGYDGEYQGFVISEKGEPGRWYADEGRLPREIGRILSMLHQLGYELPPVQMGIARRYQAYIVSHRWNSYEESVKLRIQGGQLMNLTKVCRVKAKKLPFC